MAGSQILRSRELRKGIALQEYDMVVDFEIVYGEDLNELSAEIAYRQREHGAVQIGESLYDKDSGVHLAVVKRQYTPGG